MSDGRVTKDFEIQEAITFRDGAAAAFADLEPRLLAIDRAATRRVKAALVSLAASLVTASRGGTPVAPDALDATVSSAVDDLQALYPSEWKDAAKTADFDVIAAALDRMEAAAASGDWGVAESARIEAYGIFELGPEQRLRGLAPSLFQGVESLFWYGSGDQDGLVRLIKAKASTAELASVRAALDAELAEAEQRIGSGPGSRVTIVTNSAMIVFREGLEAVLILAALMASMVGAQRRYRRPLLGGVVLALGASVVTWIVAQTVLGSLARYGERLEAIVSLVAIGMLLLILNWFYHRVYWQEHLAELHGKKKSIMQGAGLSLAAAQVAGLVALGFTSVYREGFETVLFLQALTLEAGAWTVLEGVALGFAAVVGRLLPRHRARAEAAAQEDAHRDRPDDHVGARRARRADGADPAEGRLGARDADRGPRPAVLGRSLARPLPDVGGPRRPGGGARLRDRELRRGRGGPQPPSRAHPRCADRRAARRRVDPFVVAPGRTTETVEAKDVDFGAAETGV